MNIPDKDKFHPSAETLKKWLATRKPALSVGGLEIPGFFSDTGNSADTTWFWVAVLGELAGLVATMYGGANGGPQFMLIALLGVVMFIFCDFFFAQKLHRNQKLKCELRTKKMLYDDSEAAKIVSLNQQLEKGKMADFFLKMGIVLIALIKVAAIVLLGVFNSIVLYLPFMIIFLIVAYVHIYHTGYYFAHRSTQKSIDREHAQFGGGAFKAKEPEGLVETPKSLRKLPIKHNPHEIVEDTDKGGNNYLIKTIGVLTDNDIINLISGQEDANKIALFKACRKLQLENLEGQSNR